MSQRPPAESGKPPAEELAVVMHLAIHGLIGKAAPGSMSVEETVGVANLFHRFVEAVGLDPEAIGKAAEQLSRERADVKDRKLRRMGGFVVAEDN